ncbi:MAG TPA: TRL domain-containing protein [Nitrospiria bacterium]
MVVLLSGCLPKTCISPSLARNQPVFFYSHTTQPLDLNMKETPVSSKKGKGNTKHLEYQVSIEWDSNAIGDIAKDNGMQRVYFADIENLCVLGIWEQSTVHIYGE